MLRQVPEPVTGCSIPYSEGEGSGGGSSKGEEPNNNDNNDVL
jgi:hypothetical protein